MTPAQRLSARLKACGYAGDPEQLAAEQLGAKPACLSAQDWLAQMMLEAPNHAPPPVEKAGPAPETEETRLAKLTAKYQAFGFPQAAKMADARMGQLNRRTTSIADHFTAVMGETKTGAELHLAVQLRRAAQ